MESTPGPTFLWENDRGSFRLGDVEYVGDKNLYDLMKKASNGLVKQLTENEKLSFEIQTVFAVRK